MKEKTCPICRKKYAPEFFAQKACSPKCAIAYVRQERRKAIKKQTRIARSRLKSLSELLKEAQAAFNRFIRLRDAHLPCISCGTMADVQYAAGHYRTVGAAGHLRFNEDNVHKQCNKNCNSELSGNIVNYRKGLIERIGLERVEALENDNTIKRWTKDEANAIKALYRQKARELEKMI